MKIKVYKIHYNDDINSLIVKDIKDVTETIGSGEVGDEYKVEITETEQDDYEKLPEFDGF